jgi:chloramphenicol 3-O phosphotransferase
MNGTTSSGKTSIALELQHMFAEPYLHLGIDKFSVMLPRRYYSYVDPPEHPAALEGFYWLQFESENESIGLIKEGPVGNTLLRGMHRACAGLAAAGNNLIIDDVLMEHEHLGDYLAVLADFEVYFVGVHCSLDVLEQRERERGDRCIGQARGQIDLIHQGTIYDIELDTTSTSTQDCAQKIFQRLENGPAPTAFSQIRMSV